jgi:small subunit ribosomal protein S16
MLVIRLTRVGKKNSPAYRVVVADKKRAVKRKFIEIIGNYNPTLTPKQIVIAKDRALFWIKLGAQPSPTVHNLMCDMEILPKKDKIKKIFGKKETKKSIKAGPEAETVRPKPEAETDATAETNESTAPTPQPEIEGTESSDESAHSGLSESSDQPESIGKDAKIEEQAAELVEDVPLAPVAKESVQVKITDEKKTAFEEKVAVEESDQPKVKNKKE